MNGLDLRLPNGNLLLDKASLTLRPGETVSVGGPSGSGKTTLFRALAGLWPFGKGEMRSPAGWRALFLPQRPYLPIGTLRDALTYPDRTDAFDEATCREVLEACLLGHLAGRLDETGNWSLALSVGEQQRLAFARALLLKPNWIFIDEGHVGARHGDGGASLRAAQGEAAGHGDRQHRAPAGCGRFPRPPFSHRPAAVMRWSRTVPGGKPRARVGVSTMKSPGMP